MTNSGILAQAEAIVHLGTIGEMGKRHDAIEGMRRMIEKADGSKVPCSVGLVALVEEWRSLADYWRKLGGESMNEECKWEFGGFADTFDCCADKLEELIEKSN